MAPVVLEARAEPTGSWPRYYESLSLFSPRATRACPSGRCRATRSATRPRAELAAYLRDYADWLGADIRTGQRVTRVAVLDDHAFEVETEAGLVLHAPI